MKAKIVVITSRFLRSFVEKSFEEMQADCEVEIAEYEHFDQLPEIYRRCEETADAFMISGTTALAVIRNGLGSLKKPIVSFHADLISFYRALITLFLEKRDLDPSRTVFDFLLPIAKDATVDHLIHGMKLSELGAEIETWVDKTVQSGSSDMELRMIQKCMELWRQGKIDMVLCLYSSIVPLLEESGIPCYFIYPVKEQLETQIRQLLTRVELEKMHDNLPAVIAVASRNAGGAAEPLRRKFRGAVEKEMKEMLLDKILQESGGHFYCFTSCREVSLLTDDLTFCPVCARLKKKYRLPAAVGYGIGQTIAEAKKHAEAALKEALFAGGSFAMDERENLLGALDSKRFLKVDETVSEDIYALSQRCRLSTLTIQKLISITKLTGSLQITTQELAERMGVTVRNANRILQNLEKGGAAMVAHTKSVNTKGRPVKVYQLKL